MVVSLIADKLSEFQRNLQWRENLLLIDKLCILINQVKKIFLKFELRNIYINIYLN